MRWMILLAYCACAAEAAAGPNSDRPDIYGLINILYLKADANLDGHITQTELSDVFKGFDKNGDGTVTNSEFVELWMILTSQTNALANAYFHLGDLNDDKVIDQHDYPIMFQIFDLDHDGSVSSKEFGTKWEDIIRETPFAVLFERADKNQDEFLSHGEFRGFFDSFDKNNDHAVSNAEFDEGWQHADFALLSDSHQLFGDVDKDGSGAIDSHDMDALFSQYDTNGDNKIALQEVIQLKNLLTLSQGGGAPVG
ncbi:uncharacterized protein LOC128224756 [Mya arenaria]|uniref:uncharacterized protein LOC128224756 n=1 Tax=Mya arenaria TaxID=6604 RepID=UPI0022E8D67F|nr:uncharacterized protein LOC128224756 [Mya arenaria]